MDKNGLLTTYHANNVNVMKQGFLYRNQNKNAYTFAHYARINRVSNFSDSKEPNFT